jgi:acetyl-CoA C-acetyltransferase
MRPVSVAGIGWIPVQKQCALSLREMGRDALRAALDDAGIEMLDALYAANTLGSELWGEKHIAALIADASGLSGVEALQADATSASGAAALRMAYLAVASGQADFAAAVGVEKMRDTESATPVLARALDQASEAGQTMVSINAHVMRSYMAARRAAGVSEQELREGFAHFSVNAHANGAKNPDAFLRKPLTLEDAMTARLVDDPLRLSDCSPVCDGAACIILTSSAIAESLGDAPVALAGSACATDRVSVASRKNPLLLTAARYSAEKALREAALSREDIDFFEVHDAFSIMAVLSLEACGFLPEGQGFRAASEGMIYPGSRLPLSTMGGLKSRGHPVAATALYQACEVVRQLRGTAGEGQIPVSTALMQSIGGAGTTILTHVFRMR